MATRSPMSMRSVTAPAVDDPLELVGQRHRRPHAAFGVQGDAVGRPVQTVGEDAPVTQRAAVVDGERGEPAADRFGDDQGLSIRRDHHSVGKVEVLGDDGGAVVRIKAHDHAAGECLGPDVGAPGGVDDHIAEAGRNQGREIGDLHDGFSVVPQHLPVFG